jgi:2-C-methyl-D-erythritol 4-phosphate cytidylyltransferase
MGADIPKQYLSCAGKPLIWHALNTFQQCRWITEIFVALSAEDELFEELIGEQFDKVTRVLGGASRAESVLNALSEVSRTHPLNCWTMVHDAARPCLSASDIAQIAAYIESNPEQGMILADKVHDTVKQASDNDYIDATVDRSRLWRALTPQVFRLGDLKRALETGQLSDITDEASAMERAGYAPRLIQGDARNIKVTRQADLALAELFLKQLESESCA